MLVIVTILVIFGRALKVAALLMHCWLAVCEFGQKAGYLFWQSATCVHRNIAYKTPNIKIPAKFTVKMRLGMGDKVSGLTEESD